MAVITDAQLRILRIIEARPLGDAREIGEGARKDRPWAQRNLIPLLNRGFVSRSAEPVSWNNSRVYTITDKGRRFLERVTAPPPM